jgi:hypothetical protein
MHPLCVAFIVEHSVYYNVFTILTCVRKYNRCFFLTILWKYRCAKLRVKIKFIKTYEVHVRLRVLTAVSMKFRFVFWDVLPCKIIVYRRFRGTFCLHHQEDEYHPDDGGSTYFWNVGLQLFYTAVHIRRQIWTSLEIKLSRRIELLKAEQVRTMLLWVVSGR